MNDLDIKQAYFDWIKIYTKNAKLNAIKNYDDAPAIIKIAIDKMILYENKDNSVQSEAIADLKISYFEGNGLPSDVLELLRPYLVRKATFL